MAARMRISKIVIAALLGGSAAIGGVMLPVTSYAQTLPGGAEVSLTVNEPGQRQKRLVDCDVVITVTKLPPGQNFVTFTTSDGKVHQLPLGTFCIRGNEVAVIGTGAPPPPPPPGGPGQPGQPPCTPKQTPTKVICP